MPAILLEQLRTDRVSIGEVAVVAQRDAVRRVHVKRLRLVRAFRLCTSRHPEARELEILTQLLAEQRAHFAVHPEEAAKLIKVGQRAPDAALDPVELAAWSVTAKALLNFDETYTKR